MPIDWDELLAHADEAIDGAAERTDDRLASDVSSLTTMTDAEVKELFPEPADVKKLGELMKIVNAATDRNTKVNNIITNVEELGGVILTLVSKFA